jgi:hypothetical protein
MKTLRWKTFPFLFVLILTSCTGCDDAIDPTLLPAETQSGKNTFGCYVGSDIFVNPYRNNTWLKANYFRDSNNQYFVSINTHNNVGKSINIIFNNFELNKRNSIRSVEYIYYSDTIKLAGGGYTFKTNTYFGKNIPAITLTKFDTLNHIISGKFEFDLKNSEDTTKVFKFTQGRFDMYLSIIK